MLAQTGAVGTAYTRRSDMSVRMIGGAPPPQADAARPLRLTSRCRLTPKGRLQMDPVRVGPNRSLPLNATGRFVVERCDGSHSVTDVARALANAFQVPEARTATDVLSFLETLREWGLVQAEDGSDAAAQT
jgi:hypothetical protein